MPQLVLGKNSFSIISRLSSKGMLVYKLVTSKVKKFFVGRILILSNFLRKSGVYYKLVLQVGYVAEFSIWALVRAWVRAWVWTTATDQKCGEIVSGHIFHI